MRIDTALFSRNRSRGPRAAPSGRWRGEVRERRERDGERQGEMERDEERSKEREGDRRGDRRGMGRRVGGAERRAGRGTERESEREGKATETKKRKERDWEGTSPVVQGLRLRDPTAGRAGWIPGQGTENPPAARCKGSERERERWRGERRGKTKPREMTG